MKIEYLLISLFLFLSLWLIPKLSFINNSKLSSKEIRVMLCFKYVISILSALYIIKYSTTFDYNNYNIEGLAQYDLLLTNPVLFFTDFTIDINTYGWGGLLASGNSFWAYLRFNLLFKMIAFFNLVSRGNFYFNTLLFSTLTFFGHIAFYRIFPTFTRVINTA